VRDGVDYVINFMVLFSHSVHERTGQSRTGIEEKDREEEEEER